jgi:hypothetical protein
MAVFGRISNLSFLIKPYVIARDRHRRYGELHCPWFNDQSSASNFEQTEPLRIVLAYDFANNCKNGLLVCIRRRRAWHAAMCDSGVLGKETMPQRPTSLFTATVMARMP